MLGPQSGRNAVQKRYLETFPFNISFCFFFFVNRFFSVFRCTEFYAVRHSTVSLAFATRLLKKCLYAEYFQSKIYQITHTPIRNRNSLTSRPKRFFTTAGYASLLPRRRESSFISHFSFFFHPSEVRPMSSDQSDSSTFILQTARVSWNAIYRHC